LLLAAAAASVAPAPPPPDESGSGARFYETQVKPILQQHCLKCHGDEGKVKGELRLDSRQAILAGGETGPAVSLEKPGDSLLLKALGHADPTLKMPPKEKLAPEKIAVLTRWVEMGLPFAGGSAPLSAATTQPRVRPGQVTPEAMRFWSFQPVTRPAVPQVRQKEWARTPIDAFVLARLEAAGLMPAPPATKTALLRRAYYDLTGLPPTPAEVDTFLADTSIEAFEKVIDRLLDSPRYGEKWGRHWLDLVRFAETNSFERDSIKPNAWRYRDYVIEAFNADKPYDQFVREQIAGDELDAVTSDSIIATGYYRLGTWDDEPTDRLQAKYDVLDDVVATTGQVFLGLTINCARCHDHKLDPIPQKDYYRLLAFFHGIKPYERDGPNVLTDIAPADQLKAYQDELETLKRSREELAAQMLVIEAPVIATLPPGERKLPADFGQRDKLLAPKVRKAITEEEARRYDEMRAMMKRLIARKPTAPPQALSVKEAGPTPEPTFVLRRGSAHSKGERVEPGFPAVLSPPAATIPPARLGAKSSGRRRVLADWIASDRNPLAARVMANRVWQYHFGRGIVRSPSDFGTIGDRPTHPELLDYLAGELVARGWRLKAIHKLVMMSSAYQMSAAANAEALAKDPQNNLFWRFDLRRLQAEEVRDSILAANGRLNLKMGGPGIFPTIPQLVLQGQSRPGEGWGKSTPEEQARRSVYIHQKRSLPVPALATLDAPDPDASCPARFTTTQATQALTMLNSDFTNEEAKVFAARMRKEAPGGPREQVRLALRLTLSREPSGAEVERGTAYMASLVKELKVTPEVALDQFCLLAINLNEFVYVD